jgi:hypothetical protein
MSASAPLLERELESLRAREDTMTRAKRLLARRL